MKTLLALTAGLVSTGAALAFTDLARAAPAAIQSYISSSFPFGNNEMLYSCIGLMLFVAFRRSQKSN